MYRGKTICMNTIPIFFNQCFNKKRLKRLVLWSLTYQGEFKTLQMLDELKSLGFHYATYAGVSLSIDDLKIPPKKRLEVLEAQAMILQTLHGRTRGYRTAIEEIQGRVDTWHRASETVKDHVIDFFEATDILNPVYMMAFSGARGNVSQVRQLVGMRGLMADTKGDIIGYAIRSNFREGLTITEYMISAYGARKGVVDTALRTADAGYLTRRLVDVAQQIIVQQGSCGTQRGIVLQPIKEGQKVVLSLQDRLLGRVLARDVLVNGEKIASRNQVIDHQLAMDISAYIGVASEVQGDKKVRAGQVLTHQEKETTSKIFVRSPLTCNLGDGVCQLCYGWSFAQNRLVPIGEAVGIMAGQSIGEPGTQLTMRTFHTGGVFTGEVQAAFRAPSSGIIHYPQAFPGACVRTPYGQIAFLAKTEGFLCIRDPESQEETRVKVPSHTALFFREGERVVKREILGLVGGLDDTGNEKLETRKIVFSEFDGEVMYQNVLLRSCLYPEDPVEKARREKREAKQKRPTLAETVTETMRLKRHITLTGRVGTFWILAGRKVDDAYKTLPLFQSSGHFVQERTIFKRSAILTPEEGFLRHHSSLPTSPSFDASALSTKPSTGPSLALSPLTVTRPFGQKNETQATRRLLLPRTPTYQLDQNIDKNAPVTTIPSATTFFGDEAAVYQPVLHIAYEKGQVDVFHDSFALRVNTGEIFVIPNWSRQFNFNSHSIDYRAFLGQRFSRIANQLSRIIYPFPTKDPQSSARADSPTVDFFYFDTGYQTNQRSAFMWHDDYLTDVDGYRLAGLFPLRKSLRPWFAQNVNHRCSRNTHV